MININGGLKDVVIQKQLHSLQAMKDHIQSETGNILRQGLMHHKIFSEDTRPD
jgi:hypothetical protein